MDVEVSTFVGTAVTIGLMTASYFCNFFALRYAVDQGNIAAAGAVHGAPLSTRHRWTLLLHGTLPAFAALVIFNFFVAVGFLTLAEGASGSLAWLIKAAAGVAGFGGIFQVIFFAVAMHHFIAVLREESK